MSHQINHPRPLKTENGFVSSKNAPRRTSGTHPHCEWAPAVLPPSFRATQPPTPQPITISDGQPLTDNKRHLQFPEYPSVSPCMSIFYNRSLSQNWLRFAKNANPHPPSCFGTANAPFSILFTLETARGRWLGRLVQDSSSCPRRPPRSPRFSKFPTNAHEPHYSQHSPCHFQNNWFCFFKNANPHPTSLPEDRKCFTPQSSVLSSPSGLPGPTPRRGWVPEVLSPCIPAPSRVAYSAFWQAFLTEKQSAECPQAPPGHTHPGYSTQKGHPT